MSKTLEDVSRLLATESAKIEDSAVAEYVRQQCKWVIGMGENLNDYYLVRQNGNITTDEGNSIKQGVYYGLIHKDNVKKVDYPND